MGRQHINDGAISVRQIKTGREVWIPVHDALMPILAGASANLTFLVTDRGKPYTAAVFGNWFRDQCRAAGLYGCSAHGLRKAAGIVQHHPHAHGQASSFASRAASGAPQQSLTRGG